MSVHVAGLESIHIGNRDVAIPAKSSSAELVEAQEWVLMALLN